MAGNAALRGNIGLQCKHERANMRDGERAYLN